MKKTNYLIVLLFVGASAAVFAQTTTTTTTTTTEDETLKSKRGFPILPVADEWALGISAQPFLRYVGNIFNLNQNAEPSFDFTKSPATDAFAVFGKKMVDANTAYRARFNVSSASNTNKVLIDKDLLTSDPLHPQYVDDKQRLKSTQIVLAAGIEKRRGKSRVQGIYGAEAVIGFFSSKTVYDYGNGFSTDFTDPSTTDFGNNVGGAGRITEIKGGKSFLVGVRGFAGVEYFIAPKVSLGGEFGYMLSFQTKGKTTITTESWDGGNDRVQKVKTKRYDDGISNVGLGLDNLNASINLLFYF